MNLHEYQTKQVLAKYGIPTLAGRVAESPEQAAEAYRAIGSAVAIVKAQIHAGGRGKGGGVKLVRSADEARDVALKLLGRSLVTPQTGPQGRIVRKVLVEAGCDIGRELYLGCVLDRRLGQPVLMASKQGGMEIEEVAARDPAAILKQPIDVGYGLQPFQGRALGFGLGLEGDTFKAFTAMAAAVARMFIQCDCSLLEINPLVVTKEGGIVALDGKMGIDDRALDLKKQPELEAMRDVHEEDPIEHEAASYGLNYVSMEGTIGCMVNGAGLAMSTMDIIKLAGGSPANFLDVGGGANKDQVKKAFKLLLANPTVKAVLINIFGGILKCDVLAQGIVDAVKEIHVAIPIVVRLEGTNVDAGRKILGESGLKIISAADMADAAQKVIAAAQ
ncbi:MAG TPA: ADP-forming succinate--CoA ligase subunit beta [Planctomycetota bacterium]|nr:ADP-forming succinate--CoA ligase subunit beta [Planctomycetota bacterium]